MKHRARPKSIYQITTYLAAVILLLILFVLGGFFFMVPDPDGAQQYAELMDQLRTNRQYWREKRPAEFRYVVDRDCLCDELWQKPYVATERGEQRSAEYLVGIGREEAVVGRTPPEAAWIRDIFDAVEQAVSRSELDQVTYDARFGYPTLVVLTPTANGSRREFRVRDFEVIRYE